MMNKAQFYTNRQEYSGGCPQIPTRSTNFLDKNNCLSEFLTPTDKEAARANLGIPDIIRDLNLKIDTKVINEGDITWDTKPTEGNIDKLLSSHTVYLTLLNYVLKDELDDNIQLLYTNIINKILNLLEDYLNLLNHFAELKAFVKDEHLNLYQTLQCDINKDLIIPLEQKIDNISLLVESFLKTSGGTALSNLFGNNEYIGISQKTLTTALNKIWEKIESITGEISNGINMIVTPQYFIGDNGCTLNVSVVPCLDDQIFEHIAFYINNVLIQESDDVKSFSFSTQIEETSEIKCIAKILGVEYETSKIINKYNKFFLFTGNFESTEHIILYAMNHPEFVIPLTEGLRSSHNVTCLDGDNIYILIGNSLLENFIRADLNGLEIPLEQKTVVINEENYQLFTSVNTYNEGVYNIDING